MQHRGRGDADLGRAGGDALEKVEVAPLDAAVWRTGAVTRMVGGRKPTSLPSSRRNVAVKLPSSDLDAVELLEEVDAEEGAAELAVGDALEADLLLAAHHVADRRVLDHAQRLGHLAASMARAASSRRRGAESCRRDRHDRVAWCGMACLPNCGPSAPCAMLPIVDPTIVAMIWARASQACTRPAPVPEAVVKCQCGCVQLTPDYGACGQLATRAGPFVIGGLDPSRPAVVSGRSRTMTGIRIARSQARSSSPLATAAGAEELRLAHWVPAQHPLQPTGTGALGALDRRGLGRAAHHHHLPRAAAGRRARSLRHGARRHRRHRVSSIRATRRAASRSLPTARSRFFITNAKGGSKALDAWYREYADEEMGDVKFCMAFPALAGHLPLEGQAHLCRGRGRQEHPAGARHPRTLRQHAGRGERLGAGTGSARDIGAGCCRCHHLPMELALHLRHRRHHHHHLDIPLYVTTFVLVMNKTRYEGLADADRQVIDEHCTSE